MNKKFFFKLKVFFPRVRAACFFFGYAHGLNAFFNGLARHMFNATYTVQILGLATVIHIRKAYPSSYLYWCICRIFVRGDLSDRAKLP